MASKVIHDTPVPKPPAGKNDVVETSRQAALQSAANLLEALAQAQKLRKRAHATLDDRTDFDDKSQSTARDFLFDIMRLNASFLNELAKIGSRNSDIVKRAMENMYSAATNNAKHAETRELSFNLKQVEQAFVVQNDAAPMSQTLRLTWQNVLHGRPNPVQPFSLRVQGSDSDRINVVCDDDGQCSANVGVNFGVPKVLLLKIKTRPNPFLERRYHTELAIRLQLANGKWLVRRIPINIDMRPEQDRKVRK
jgi:hypothetical protein